MRSNRDQDEGERLQKVLARAGIASRRACEELITAGRVKVNGKLVTELGTRVDPLVDQLMVDGKPVDPNRQFQYYMLYKPRGYITTAADPEGRHLAEELVPGEERLFSVGRLDMESEGLLLFTNDGALSLRLMHPRYRHEKEYLVLTDSSVTQPELEQMAAGIILAGETSPCRAVVQVLPPQTRWEGSAAEPGQIWLSFVLRQGRKRQIRRMLEHFGHRVFRLVRTRVGTLRLGRLKPGQGRWLDEGEVKALRQQVGLEEPRISTKGRSSGQNYHRDRRPSSVRQEHRRRRPGS